MNKNKIKDIIVISGKQDSGKSNSVAAIYMRLFKIKALHAFNLEQKETLQISKLPIFNEDFTALFEINSIRIGLISNGDNIYDFKPEFGKIRNNIDILICAARSLYKTSSVYEFLVEKAPAQGFRIKLNLSTFPILDSKDDVYKTDMENTIADTVISFLESNYQIG